MILIIWVCLNLLIDLISQKLLFYRSCIQFISVIEFIPGSVCRFILYLKQISNKNHFLYLYVCFINFNIIGLNFIDYYSIKKTLYFINAW